jgi:K+-sensing histidine kinase KdpD
MNDTWVGGGGESVLQRDIAAIAHDLKSPLSAIALEATLLGEKLDRNERCSGRRCVERITRNVAFLDRLVLDLLDASSLASGNFRLRREPTDLTPFLASVLDRVTLGSMRRRVHLDSAKRATVMLDPHRIERVIANLLDNAAKYSHDGSRVIVRATTYETFISVSVIDEGPGIGSTELPFIFDRFRRGESARVDGHGLGLYVSKRIVEAHGGQISVESIAGVGSRFFFDLPTN